jgi:hypothetical protein
MCRCTSSTSLGPALSCHVERYVSKRDQVYPCTIIVIHDLTLAEPEYVEQEHPTILPFPFRLISFNPIQVALARPELVLPVHDCRLRHLTSK